MRDHNKKLN